MEEESEHPTVVAAQAQHRDSADQEEPGGRCEAGHQSGATVERPSARADQSPTTDHRRERWCWRGQEEEEAEVVAVLEER